MPFQQVEFEHRIETRQVRFGKWIYIIHLQDNKSQPSRRFMTEEAAIADARQMLSFMH